MEKEYQMASQIINNVQKSYNLPDKAVFCKRCLTSNQRPRINFDDSGVCNACNYAYKKEHVLDWPERARELNDLLDAWRFRTPYRWGATREAVDQFTPTHLPLSTSRTSALNGSKSSLAMSSTPARV